MEFDINLIAIVAAVAVAVIGFLSGRSFESATGALAKLPAAAEAAASIVAGVQKLKENGEIGDNNAAFNLAYSQLKKLFPDLDEGYLKMTIEGAYLLLKKQLESGLITGDTSYQVGHRGVR